MCMCLCAQVLSVPCTGLGDAQAKLLSKLGGSLQVLNIRWGGLGCDLIQSRPVFKFQTPDGAGQVAQQAGGQPAGVEQGDCSAGSGRMHVRSGRMQDATHNVGLSTAELLGKYMVARKIPCCRLLAAA